MHQVLIVAAPTEKWSEFSRALKGILSRFPGSAAVEILICEGHRTSRATFPPAYRVQPCSELYAELEKWPGVLAGQVESD